MASMAFLGISPGGKAIYRGAGDYSLFAAGGPAPADPVIAPSTGGSAAFFFADR